MCSICKHAASDGFEECPKCGKKFYRCPTCGQPWAEEPRNLAKPNAQLAVSEVLEAWRKDKGIPESSPVYADLKEKLSEYFA